MEVRVLSSALLSARGRFFMMAFTQLFLPLVKAKNLLGKWEKNAPAPLPKAARDAPEPWKYGIAVRVLRRMRARRYLLRLLPDGTVRLVIPRRGSRAEAFRFLERNERWLLERHRHWSERAPTRQPWRQGTSFLFRGDQIVLNVEGTRLRFAHEAMDIGADQDYRKAVLGHLRSLAEQELPIRTQELAQVHGITIKRVTVRAQKTRWGSCSARGTISLNWRIIQAPPSVRDYLILHELMHRREMNHSARYWKLVEAAFPDYRAAEHWLKQTRLEAMD